MLQTSISAGDPSQILLWELTVFLQTP